MKLPRAELKKARIEIIPMIDTIFFLLVFFIYSSLQRVTMSAPQVKLPESSTARGKTTQKIVVTVDDTGKYFLDKGNIEFSQILPKLKSEIERNPDLVVVINADKTQKVGQLQGLIDVAKQSDPAKLYIATAPNDDAAEATNTTTTTQGAGTSK
ncbi:MAG: biopolymer transporter ExbD [Cytophagales bacterium]|nr:biopolymer transporter ExbD [Armatimonadota bacterium]